MDCPLYCQSDSLHVGNHPHMEIFSILTNTGTPFKTEFSFFERIHGSSNPIRSEVDSDKSIIIVNVCNSKTHEKSVEKQDEEYRKSREKQVWGEICIKIGNTVHFRKKFKKVYFYFYGSLEKSKKHLTSVVPPEFYPISLFHRYYVSYTPLRRSDTPESWCMEVCG